MSRTAIVVKQQKLEELRLNCIKLWKKMPKSTKFYNRCKLCWRVRSYMREFGICRICFRRYAREWIIMWVKKASW